MFLDEARLSAHLSHSNIVQVFDIGVGERTYFIVRVRDGADLKVPTRTCAVKADLSFRGCGPYRDQGCQGSTTLTRKPTPRASHSTPCIATCLPRTC